MSTMTITSKRQATLPRDLCDELHLSAGDQVDVERAMVDGQAVWVLRPRHLDWSWIGSVQPTAQVSHDLADIRASIGRGIAVDRA